MNIKLHFPLVFVLLVILVAASVGPAHAQTAIIIGPDTLLAAFETSYSQQLTASGGTEPYTFSLLSGDLPTGINMSSDGLLSGFADFPAAPGAYPITIQVVDANGAFASRAYDFVLEKGTPIVKTMAAAQIFWKSTFNISAEVTMKISDSQSSVLGGTVAFSIDGTSVPGCSAVPQVDGYYLCENVSMELVVGKHTVRADYTPNDWFPAYYTPGSDSIEITVQPRPLSLMGDLFKDTDQNGIWEEGEPRIYEDNWTVNLDQGCDGTVDYWTLTGWGGFYFNNIPVSGQCHRITVIGAAGYLQTTQLADFVPQPGTMTFLRVGFYYPTIVLTPGTYNLPSGTSGVEYTQEFSASGGTTPYVYTIIGGSLPDGLTLSEDGILSGTPTSAGGSAFTVQAKDANQATGVKSYSLSIERVRVDGVFTFTSFSKSSTLGEAVTFTVSAAVADNGAIPPVGVVTFFAGGTPIGGCSYLYLNVMIDTYGFPIFGDYPVTCTTASLGTGTHMITAAYTDWMGYYNDASLSLTQVVRAPVSADLAISKTESKDPIKPGARLVYTLTVSNLGPVSAESVTLVDRLDINTTYVSITAQKGWTCKHVKGTVTCTKSSMASGETATFTLTVTVSKTVKIGKELVNNAEVSSTTIDPELNNNAVVQKTLVMK